MLKDGYVPEITDVIKDQGKEFFIPIHKDIISKIIRKVVPNNFFDHPEQEADLPILKSYLSYQVPGHLTLYAFGRYQKHAVKFFIEMLSNWLVPGKKLNLTMMFSSAFCMPNFGSSVYLAMEAVIHIGSDVELNQVKINLPIVESEICLGMESSFYAKRIMEVKGLSTDAKTAIIQDTISHLTERMPEHFDFDLFTDMQHILVMCRDEFKVQRTCRHLSRIIGIQYLFRKQLMAKMKLSNKRQVFLKIFRAELQAEDQKNCVLGIIVGINFLREKEIFDKRHLMRIIQNLIPDANLIEDSFFDNRRSNEHFSTLYLEIQKSNGKKISNQEICKIREVLPSELMERGIEQIVHPIFMPRNEEEIMRNILSLSNQIKYLRDLPQVMISFDEQTHSKLSFTVIVVRVLKPGDHSIKDLFLESDSFLDYIHDRCKTVGYLRSKYVKEATVFGIKVNKDKYIRRDHTIDLNKARQAVVFELLRIIGEFRDFNGGMISKQNELLQEIKDFMEGDVRFDELLLENFFFSISPTIMRTVLEPYVLCTFFLMLLDAIDTNFLEQKHLVMIEKKSSMAFAIVKSEKKLNRDELLRTLNILQAKPSELAMAEVKVLGVHYNGFIYRCSDPIRQEQFGSIIKHTVGRMFRPGGSTPGPGQRANGPLHTHAQMS